MIVILEVNKHLFEYCILLEIDFQTHVFGYPNTCIWISNHACLDLFFTGYPCDSNEALCIINEFEKTCSHTRAMFLKTGRQISYLRAAM